MRSLQACGHYAGGEGEGGKILWGRGIVKLSSRARCSAKRCIADTGSEDRAVLADF